ncbi:MAG: hypothetical protein LBO64_02350, partial [Desulfovibrio sp.]|nr:hypothetical protein [Desulfovibrio sp.]
EEWAHKWADNPEDDVVKDDEFSAFHWARKSEASAALAGEFAENISFISDELQSALDIIGSSLPKAWLICARNGTIVAAKNVASVTRVSAGIYTINFPEGVFATNQIIPCGIAHMYPMQTMSGDPNTAAFTPTSVTVTTGATYQTPRDSEFRLVFFEDGDA